MLQENYEDHSKEYSMLCEQVNRHVPDDHKYYKDRVLIRGQNVYPLAKLWNMAMEIAQSVYPETKIYWDTLLSKFERWYWKNHRAPTIHQALATWVLKLIKDKNNLVS